MVGILQSTIVFANNDEDEDNMDRECQKKNESAASNYIFQCSQWQHIIMHCHFYILQTIITLFQ